MRWGDDVKSKTARSLRRPLCNHGFGRETQHQHRHTQAATLPHPNPNPSPNPSPSPSPNPSPNPSPPNPNPSPPITPTLALTLAPLTLAPLTLAPLTLAPLTLATRPAGNAEAAHLQRVEVLLPLLQLRAEPAHGAHLVQDSPARPPSSWGLDGCWEGARRHEALIRQNRAHGQIHCHVSAMSTSSVHVIGGASQISWPA